MKFGKYNISMWLIVWWYIKYHTYKLLGINRNVKYPSPRWCDYPDTRDNINYCWSWAGYIDDCITLPKPCKRNDKKFMGETCKACEFYKGKGKGDAR